MCHLFKTFMEIVFPLSETETGFAVSYVRRAKLVVLGECSHSLDDRYMGSALEFVLEAAEYTEKTISR